MSETISYCICRSSDTYGFMICCDNCDEWYHGDCISITYELGMAYSKFYCLKCRDRNPSLKNKLKESTSKQGTVRKRSQSPPRSNKAARYNIEHREEYIKLDERNYEDEDDDVIIIDETPRNEKFSEKNKSELKSRPSRKEANTTSADNKHGQKEKGKELSEIDDGLRECYQWMNQYTFLSWRVQI